MGKRNQEHTVKITNMENNTTEEILCNSLSEAYFIADKHNKHIVHIHDQIKNLVEYKGTKGLDIIGIKTIEESISETYEPNTDVPIISVVEESITEEINLRTGSNTGVSFIEEPIIEESAEVVNIEVSIIEESYIEQTIPTPIIGEKVEPVVKITKTPVVKTPVVKKTSVKTTTKK